MAAWHLASEFIAPNVFEYLDIQSLTTMEITGALRTASFHLMQAFRQRGGITGAVCYATGVAVGSGPNPKLELLGFLRHRAAFLPQPSGLPTAPIFTLCAQAPGAALTMLETHPDHRDTPLGEDADSTLSAEGHPSIPVSAPQLPRGAQPLVPLAFGVRKGWPLYVEIRLAWVEHGNGEACQLGVALRSNREEAVLGAEPEPLKFSPSAGAVFQHRANGSFRSWPLEDLWVDAYPGASMILQAGVYVNALGQVFFYRRGPLTKDDSKGGDAEELPWEVTGSIDTSQGGHHEGGALEKIYVMLSLLDEQTPLRAELVRVGSTPPVPPPLTQAIEWHWRAI